MNGERPRLVKLVRDRVGQFLGGDSRVTYHNIADPDTLVRALRAKLIEEATEYLLDPSVGELADVLEVVRALSILDLGCGWLPLEEEMDAKRRERGGFLDGIGMWCTTTAPVRHEGHAINRYGGHR